MRDAIEFLVLDLLDWIGTESRPYAQVMAAWRTSCPRLDVWEEVVDRGFVEQHHVPGAGTRVSLSSSGLAHLQRARPRATDGAGRAR